MIRFDKLGQHYHSNEKVFIDKISDYCQQVIDQYVLHLTDFLNPREVQIAKEIGSHYGLKVFASRDWLLTEYSRVIIAPDYYQLDFHDFELSLLEITYANKFHKLTHPQIMGSLINQLGIDRRLFGDILLDDNGRAQFFVTTAMTDYFIMTANKIGKTPVSLKKVSLADKIESYENSVKEFVLLSSLRLDNVIATVLKIPRSRADKLIISEKVKWNYQTLDKSTRQIGLGDVVSVRGFGRFKLLGLDGYSKSGKHKATIEKFLRKKTSQ